MKKKTFSVFLPDTAIYYKRLKLHIRDASIKDIPLIRELTMKVWPHTYTPILGPEQVEYMIDLFYNPSALRQQINEAGQKFIIGFDGERAIAFASYSDAGGSIFKLHKLYVLPGQQGKGAGSMMLGHIVADVKTRRAKELHLNVNRYNYAAIAFYGKSSFTLLHDEDIDIGAGYFMNDHVLQLRIAP